MDNIGNILWQAGAESFPEFVRLAFAGLAGGLIGAYASDRLTRRREKESGIRAEKLKFIPLVDGLIDATKDCEVPNLVRGSIHRLYEPQLRFRLFLKGERLRAFNEAWGKLYQTTDDEVEAQFIFKKGDPRLVKVQQLLISRFEALREIASKA
jgi:hypothetical protein